MVTRIWIFLWVFPLCQLGLVGCLPANSELTRIQSRPIASGQTKKTGEAPLGLGEQRWINRTSAWRDGLVYIPNAAANGKAIPLLVWLHGGGGSASQYSYLLPIAEKYGIALLIPDARHNTWDGIDSPFGPDVTFLDKALQTVYSKVNIDPCKLALGGLSDGGSYALALGRSNGDLFTHIIAAAPWRLAPPSKPVGRPPILLLHGRKDTVYPIQHTEWFLQPDLQNDGYDVTFVAFNGPHWVPAPIAEMAMQWLIATPTPACEGKSEPVTNDSF